MIEHHNLDRTSHTNPSRDTTNRTGTNQPSIQLFCESTSSMHPASNYNRTVQAPQRHPAYVRIHFDWRLARVVDEDTNIVDEITWSPKRSVGALTDRLEELQSGALSPEARTLADRFPDAQPDSLAALSDPDWPDVDDEETAMLSEASARLAKRGVASAAADPDRRLDMLSGATSELRAAWGTSEARCVELSLIHI